MIPVILCVLGFAVQGLHDLRLCRDKDPGPFLTLGCTMILASGLACFAEEPAVKGTVAVLLKALIGLSAIAAAVLVKNASPSVGFGLDGRKRLVRRGGYGLVRHPAFWPFTAAAIAVGCLTGQYVWAAAAVLLELATVTVQDLVVFPGYIAGYDQYRREVPFLFPRTGRSKSGKEGHEIREKA